MGKCKKCGVEVPKEAMFCPNCGAGVSKEASVEKLSGGKGRRKKKYAILQTCKIVQRLLVVELEQYYLFF